MWNRKDQVIKGKYLGQFPYTGVVRDSRVRFGGTVRHTVDLLDPIQVLGTERFTILIDEDDNFVVDLDLNECYT
jgi:hypothetical protein